MKTQNPSRGSGYVRYSCTSVSFLLIFMAAFMHASMAHVPLKSTSPDSRVQTPVHQRSAMPASLTGLLPGSQAAMPRLSPQKAFFMENAGQITDL
ncbi:MAG: hypothetical protein LW630_10390, partial [Saprospiraceae bacterium]|nr:hypothetical protein [Saprospiraceae bacterium]